MLSISKLKIPIRFFMVWTVCLFLNDNLNAATWYVAPVSAGLGNATSWANAANDLQAVINSVSAGDEIWVAAGTYIPNRRGDALGVMTPNNRYNSFVTKDGVAIYGGFAGTETLLSQRNYTANISILSGDFNGDDIVTGTGNSLGFTANTENAYHVFISVSDGTATVLDGFTIIGGCGNAAANASITIEGVPHQPDEGGGIFIRLSSMQVRNCVIKNNYCNNFGAGLYFGNSNATLSNCLITNNGSLIGVGNAGGMFIYNGATPLISNCAFIGNKATGLGGGIYILGASSPTVVNSVFYNNDGANGGALYNSAAGTVKNSIIWGNATGGIAGTTVFVDHSIVQGGYTGTGNSSSDPLFINAADADGADNVWGNSDDGLLMSCYSPAFNSGTITPQVPLTDVRGIARPQFGAVDMGPYEDITNLSPTITVAGTPTTCTSSLSLTASGAPTLAWSGGATPSSSVNTFTSSGTYTVTGTSVAGCTNAATATVTIYPVPVITASASAPVICRNATTSLIGGGGVTYTWTGGVTNGAVFSPTSTLSYTVIGTDANTCTNSAVAGITVNILPVVTASASVPVICRNATTSLHGGGASTYTWTAGVINAAAFSPTSTLTYTVTGADVNSCTNTAVATITVNTLPAVTASASAPAICIGGTTSLHGGGATSYTWSGGVTNGSVFSPTSTLTYTVSGTGANTCTNTAVRTITVNPLPVVTASASKPVICMNGTTSLHGVGANTYVWTGGVTNAAVFSPTSTLSYTVLGTDVNSCTNTAVTSITVHPLPVITTSASAPIICMGGTTTIHGMGANTYTWTNGVIDATAFSSTITTTYTVTGTDLNGCNNTGVITLTVVPHPVVTASASSPGVCENGTVSLHGGGATTYTWSNAILNGASFTPTITETYTVTGYTPLGCRNTAVITVTVHPLPNVTANANPASAVICKGETLTLSGGGASTYTWSSIVIDGAPFTPSVTDNYFVTGTDANGCTNTASIHITVHPSAVLSATASSTGICLGGSVTLNASGATTYTWTGGVTDGVAFFPTTTTSYSLTGSIANCTNTNAIVVTVTVHPLPQITVNSGSICAGNSFEIIPAGASSYTYVNGGPTVTPVATTDYSVFGSDQNGCKNDQPVISNVVVNALPVINLTAPQTTVCSGNSLVITASGASTYSWSNGMNTAEINFTPTVSAIYSVTGTDVNSCSAAANVSITVLASPNLVVNPANPAVCIGSPITLNTSGAESVEWSTGETSLSVIKTLSVTTSYTITGKNSSNCSVVRAITVTVNPLPTVDLGPDIEISAGQPYQFNVTQTGAATYSWSGTEGLSNPNILNPELIINEEKTFTLTVTSARGCSASDDILVKVVDDLIIANYMSPNGDGKNDTWKVSNPYSIRDCRVEIIDGWGKVVYKKENGYNNEFDAADLPDGVYHYFIIKDSSLKHKGSITVTR